MPIIPVALDAQEFLDEVENMLELSFIEGVQSAHRWKRVPGAKATHEGQPLQEVMVWRCVDCNLCMSFFKQPTH